MSILIKRFYDLQKKNGGHSKRLSVTDAINSKVVNWAVLFRPGNDKLMPLLNGDVFNCASAGYLFIKFPVYAISGGSSNE